MPHSGTSMLGKGNKLGHGKQYEQRKKHMEPRPLRAYPPIYSPDPYGGRQKQVLSKISIIRWNLSDPRTQRLLKEENREARLLLEPGYSPQPTLPDPKNWSHSCARLIIDVLGGRANLTILRRWVNDALYRRLEARLLVQPTPQTPSLPAAVIRTRICQIAPSIFEAAVAVRDQDRVRAVAIRIENFRERWLITAMDIG